ncbi:MAG: TRAP transporter large permease subunit [Gracilibacteraceae bacterium]|nr:TRAP transporter large permease subunit [Gracilibacteraceae bacterium]
MLIFIAVCFFVTLFLGFPIAIAMGLTSVLALIADPNLPSLVMAQKLFTAADSFALMAIPFFMLAGKIMEATGITDELVNFAKTLVGHIRGGLGHTVVLAGTLMAGISGSQNADASAIGAITLPALRRDGYEDGFAVSIVAAAGGLGPIIPPSIIMIIYATLTNMNVGKLFLAGYIPGLMLALGYMAIIAVYARMHNLPRSRFVGWQAVGRGFLKAIWALFMPAIIIVGILSGVFTATESGVIAVLYGLVYGIVTRTINLAKLRECLLEAVVVTAIPMAIIIMANLLGYLLTRQNLANIVAEFVTGIVAGPYSFYFVLMAILLFAGMFIDGTATLLLLVPVLLPMVDILDLNPLHFALIFLLSLQTAGLTPPVGPLLFIVAGIGQVPLKKCVLPVLPFICIMLFCVVLIIFFPGIVTFIPGLIK